MKKVGARRKVAVLGDVCCFDVYCSPPPTASYTYPGDANHLGSSGTKTFAITYAFTGFSSRSTICRPSTSPRPGRPLRLNSASGGTTGWASSRPAIRWTQRIACGSASPTDVIEETVAAGGSTLSYDATTDQYTYVWKTDKAWKTTCRQLIVKFIDGTTRTANFQFK